MLHPIPQSAHHCHGPMCFIVTHPPQSCPAKTGRVFHAGQTCKQLTDTHTKTELLSYFSRMLLLTSPEMPFLLLFDEKNPGSGAIL